MILDDKQKHRSIADSGSCHPASVCHPTESMYLQNAQCNAEKTLKECANCVPNQLVLPAAFFFVTSLRRLRHRETLCVSPTKPTATPSEVAIETILYTVFSVFHVLDLKPHNRRNTRP